MVRRRSISRTIVRAALGGGFVVLTACGASMPDALGPTADGSLVPCPETPNCVHTGMRHPPGTEPIHLATGPTRDALTTALVEVVEGMKRTRVVRRSGPYLHAEATSLVFRFVDDLELLVTDERELVVRSASRVGRGDLGANARRVERLREMLSERGLLR